MKIVTGSDGESVELSTARPIKGIILDVEGEPEYEISRIVDSKIDRRRACKLLYKVLWMGYEDTDEEFSWLPATELSHAMELVSDFHAAYPAKPGPLPF